MPPVTRYRPLSSWPLRWATTGSESRCSCRKPTRAGCQWVEEAALAPEGCRARHSDVCAIYYPTEDGMADEFLDDRRRALEEAFFAKENERLLQNLRQADVGKSGQDALATVSGIADDALLGKLAALGVGSGA